MVRSKASRKIFIDSALLFLKKHKLDGMNIDWEYPTERGSPPDDKQRFASLIQEISNAFNEESSKPNGNQFVLSATVGARRELVEKAYEIPKIADYVDWVNLQTYKFHGPWENRTGHPTAMIGAQPTVPDSVTTWISGGMPVNKITLGLASYGATFHLISPLRFGYGAPTRGSGTSGKYTRSPGILAFYEICPVEWMREKTWLVSEAGATYASNNKTWVGYDTMSSIRHKVVSVVNKYNLKGISFCSLDMDDFTGSFCNSGKYPLLHEAARSMDTYNFLFSKI